MISEKIKSAAHQLYSLARHSDRCNVHNQGLCSCDVGPAYHNLLTAVTPQWIAIKDKKPTTPGFYITTHRCGSPDRPYWVSAANFWNGTEWDASYIDHWMDLPTPPGPKKDDVLGVPDGMYLETLVMKNWGQRYEATVLYQLYETGPWVRAVAEDANQLKAVRLAVDKAEKEIKKRKQT